jgi:hypothetical protein
MLSALALSMACTGEGPTGPAQTAFKIATSAVATRPAGGHCDAVISNFAINFPTITFDLDGVCQLQHLGRSALSASETVVLVGPSFSSGVITRTGSYTAANGDVLNFTFSGTSTLSATGVVFSGTETYLGGTGRFAGVSGSTAQQGTTDGVAAGQYTLNGSIIY